MGLSPVTFARAWRQLLRGSSRTPLWLACLFISTAASAQGSSLIARVEPSGGPPGTLLRISGRKLCGDTRVLLGSAELPIELCTPTVVTARVVTGAQSGPLLLETNGGKLEGPYVRVLPAPPAPVLTRVTPARAGPGALVTLEGAHFSVRLAENDVRFGELTASVASATPNRLQVWVPEGSGNLPVRVRVANAGEPSAALPFEVSPKLTLLEIVPPRAAPRAQLELRGLGFDPDPARNRVKLGPSSLRVLEAKPSRLLVQVPPDAVSGSLSVAAGSGAQVALPFEVLRAPVINGFEPAAGPSGTVIHVRGEGFGSDPSQLEVTLGELVLPVIACAPGELSVRVPPAAVSGKLKLAVRERGSAVASTDFLRTQALVLLDIRPAGGPVGSAVTLRGQGFSARPGDQRVSFGGVPAQLVSASESELSVRVPDAKTGPVVIELAGQRVASRSAFVVTSPPHIAKVSAEDLHTEAELAISGSGFGENPALVQVSLAERVLRVVSVSDQQLVVQLPSEPLEGELRVRVALQGAVSYPKPIRAH